MILQPFLCSKDYNKMERLFIKVHDRIIKKSAITKWAARIKNILEWMTRILIIFCGLFSC